MGTAKVEKVLIATHIAERDNLLRRLQEEGLLHIADFPKETMEQGANEDNKQTPEDLKQTLASLTQAIHFLAGYAPKNKGGMFASKPSLPVDEFRNRVKELDLDSRLMKINQLSEKASRLDAESRNIKTELETLAPWETLTHPPSEYTSLKRTNARFIFISSQEERKALLKALQNLTIDIQTILTEADTEYAVLLFSKDITLDVEDALKATGIKTIILKGFSKTPAQEIASRKKKLKEIEAEKQEIRRQAIEMTNELSGLQTAVDHFENEELLYNQHEKLGKTNKAAFITGWIRSSDRKALNKLLAGFGATEIRSVKPDKGEQPPVALQNISPVRPFEMIMKMYGTPDGAEADPTPFMAPFFALFFALCLTDAGYGLVITLITAYLIWVKKVRGDLVWILFYGGVLTIVTGAATGSWFGNMPDMLQIPWLMHLRDSLTWFDPLKDPMPFFYLSLGLGYFNMLFGIGIAVIDGLRTRRFGPALFESLPWFIIFLAIPLMIATSKNIALLPVSLFIPLLIVVLASLATAIVLSERPAKTSVTSAILFWILVTSALLAASKGFGFLHLPGIYIKAILIGAASSLWFYTLFKGLSGKTLKVPGLIIASIALASIVLYVSGILASNLYLALVFILNLTFGLSLLKGWGGRIIWGTYNVYSNTTGVLGIVLSYVRLMALGMVTAGVAAAFNQIAWMFEGIPVLSVILMLIVLTVGHVYNLVMSALSGFVHTLRLQYVEYLPRFFKGGGTPFEPFELKTRYVKVTRRT